MRNVIVTTEHRGVFYGEVADEVSVTDPKIELKNARMAIQWGTTRGLFQLAETGPTKSSKISATADIELVGITSILTATPAAVKAWAAM